MLVTWLYAVVQGASAGTSILAIAGTLDLNQKPVLMVSHLDVRLFTRCYSSNHRVFVRGTVTL